MPMTVLALACAYVNRGLRRNTGIIIAVYIAFAGILLTNAY
jgi:drug/metabolite transporter (DMT)-like permease